MPTVQELITDIDLRLPNAFTTAQKIVWMNEILRKIYKYMNETERKIYSFTTLSEQSIYLLPTDCVLEEILVMQMANDLIVTSDTQFTKYEYKGLNEELSNYNYYDGLNGSIGIYPIPDTTGFTFSIIYEPKPSLLSATSLTATPAINEDYHDILKFYTLSVIAKSGHNPDTDIANNYVQDYKDSWNMMIKDWMDKKSKNPTKSRCARWW